MIIHKLSQLPVCLQMPWHPEQTEETTKEDKPYSLLPSHKKWMGVIFQGTQD